MRRVVSAVAVLLRVACSLALPLSAQADQTAQPLPDAMPDAMSRAFREAFELLTAPEAAPADMTIRVVGDHQQWTYSYMRPPGPAFKSTPNAATSGQPEMDTDIVVPQGKSVELVITSNDQVYELAIQGLDASLTAIPGRIQSYTLITNNRGRLVAECSSNCEGNGRADKIAIRVVSPVDYETWLQTKIDRKP